MDKSWTITNDSTPEIDTKSFPCCRWFFLTVCLFITCLTLVKETSCGVKEEEDRRQLGEAKLHELQRRTGNSDCWRVAVAQLNSTCKQLNDMEQSWLAVSFANCHLGKSGRQTYPCEDSMSIKQCTGDMDVLAFQTYTEFFTHTGHICFFLQSQLWQEKTEDVITQLSDTSRQSLVKLQESLNYHKLIEQKQDEALHRQENILQQDRSIASALQETKHNMESAFQSMEELATQQQDLLGEVYTGLKTSIDSVHYLMSLFLVELVGYETFAVVLVTWLVILFLPQFGYSRFKLYLLLLVELGSEVVVRRVSVYMAIGAASQTPSDDLVSLRCLIILLRCNILGMLHLYSRQGRGEGLLVLVDLQTLEHVAIMH